jgi:tRNA (guanine37-N1)-methyltransferase
MRFHIITLFPQAFDSYLGESIIRRAIEDKKIRVSFYNPRDFARNKWARVDRKPYGGGPGMVLEAEPIIKAAMKAVLKKDPKKVKVIFFAPNEKQFDNAYAERAVKKYTDIVLICGRYEGVDERVKKILKAEKISVGPFVLTGGELPAMIVMDALTRRLSGVLGNSDSIEENRVAGREVYTRPDILVWKGKKYAVPKVLLSGNHKQIESWKQASKER